MFNYILYTVELLDFVVAQFSWCSKVAVPYEFTSSTKTNFESFFIETEKQRIQNITFPQISKKPTKILMIPQYMCLLVHVIQINRLT